MQDSPLLEFESWQNIIHSSDWRAFLKLLNTHKEYLQKRVNRLLSDHEDRKAGEELAKMEDCCKIISLVNKRISDLRQNQEEK